MCNAEGKVVRSWTWSHFRKIENVLFWWSEMIFSIDGETTERQGLEGINSEYPVFRGVQRDCLSFFLRSLILACALQFGFVLLGVASSADMAEQVKAWLSEITMSRNALG